MLGPGVFVLMAAFIALVGPPQETLDAPACQTCWLGDEQVGYTTTGKCFPPAYADDPPWCNGPDKSLRSEELADAEPPSTTLQVCSGGLPSLSLLSSAQNGCHSVDVSATEVASADQILYFPQSFSHVYRTSGDPACVFTAPAVDRPGDLHGATGGRDCRPEDSQCAYIAEGYHTYAVTGQSCMEAGVPACTGPLCV